ncbi:UNVERIFIED_CONTAM: hypothetical protein Sangu_2285200 [Sesamum angustifolium]|uniref:Uncharacterized protein n=1 Tax=Sesamum angustifolium TaxID=2727405 RepID=A0AAW2L8I3_9LAMI
MNTRLSFVQNATGSDITKAHAETTNNQPTTATATATAVVGKSAANKTAYYEEGIADRMDSCAATTKNRAQTATDCRHRIETEIEYQSCRTETETGHAGHRTGAADYRATLSGKKKQQKWTPRPPHASRTPRVNATPYAGDYGLPKSEMQHGGVPPPITMRIGFWNKEYVGQTFGIGAAYEHALADSWRFQLCEIATEKQLGATPTWYELKDFAIAASRSDLMMPPQRDATLLGTPTVIAIPCGVSLIGSSGFYGNCGKCWNLNVDGTAQFCLCRKLKALKGHLKAFNNLHFSHISVRAKDADLALQDAQIQLESDPENATIRDSVRELRKKAVFLAEAERHFYYQKAKLHFLKMGDRNTKFFHDMVKRNAAKSSILAITKTDGTTITSAMEIGQEFVSYFTSLLGTEVPTLPVDNAVFNWGPKLSSELALELCRVVTPEEVKQAIFSVTTKHQDRTDIQHASSNEHGILWAIKFARLCWTSLGAVVY